MKCGGNINFQEIDNEPSTGKNGKCWLLWGIFKEYIKQNIIMVVLRKANAHSVVIYSLIKKIKNVNKKRSKDKSWFKLVFFLKLPSAYEVLIRRNVL